MKKTISRIKKQELKRIAIHLALIVLSLSILTIIAFFVMRTSTRHSARSVVPNIMGISITQAKDIILKSDLNIVVNDSLFVPMYEGGTILDQLPDGGVEVKPGRTIYVTINSFLHREVQIPYIAERSLRQAKNMLETANLEIKEIIYRPDMAMNYVLEASYNGKSITRTSKLKAKIGSGITLYVGADSQTTSTNMPLLIAQNINSAKSKIWEMGLNVGKIEYDQGVNLLNQDDARIYFQYPIQNNSVALGALVDVKLTLDSDKIEKASSEAKNLVLWIKREAIKQDSINQSFKDSLNRVELNILETNKNLSVEDILESETNDDFFD